MFLLIFLAVAAGFALGRFPSIGFAGWTWPTYKWRPAQRKGFADAYLLGLNQLLSEQQDAAIDTFLDALEVNSQTIETHFALGAVVRRRGQLDRAIRIHQNILASDLLDTALRAQAQLELAVDYDSAGLLDRAENLLLALTNHPLGSIRTQAYRYLVQIFEKEGEWQKALQAADNLCAHLPHSQVKHWRYLQAHYCCELAGSSIELDSEKLILAEQYCEQHPRTYIQQAQLLLDQKEPGLALQKLHTVAASARYLQVVVPLMKHCLKALQTDGLVAQELLELFRRHGNYSLVPFIAEHILEQGERSSMVEFVQKALSANTELPYFSGLLALTDSDNIDCSKLVALLHLSLPFRFHCDHCGFSGAHWHWCCPACQSWM